jgi:outer membrane immunogenic protein
MRVLIAACALLAATGLTWAADSPSAPASAVNQASPPAAAPTPPYSWAGFYISSSGDLSLGTGATTSKLDGSFSTLNGIGLGGSANGMSGGQFDANWQNGNTVFGFEGDMQWTGVSSTPFTDCGVGCSLSDREKVPYLATLRARAGKTFDRVFVYGTGGFAKIGRADNLNADGVGTTPDFMDLAGGNLDWTIGGGMEFALDHNVSAKIEYLYSTPTGTLLSPFDSDSNMSAKNNILRGGFDYRLPIDP